MWSRVLLGRFASCLNSASRRAVVAQRYASSSASSSWTSRRGFPGRSSAAAVVATTVITAAAAYSFDADSGVVLAESPVADANTASSISVDNANDKQVFGDEVVEPYTGHRFQQRRQCWTMQPWACRVEDRKETIAECHQEKLKLIGVGIRCMLDNCSISLLRAYSVGLYISEDKLSGIAGSGASLQQVLASSGVTKSLCLVMARSVSAGHIAHGLERSISKHISNEADRPKLTELVQTIRNDRKNLEAGDELMLTCGAYGDLIVSQQSRVLLVLPAAATLCDAIMDAYVGDRPVSFRAKNSFVSAWNRIAGRSQ